MTRLSSGKDECSMITYAHVVKVNKKIPKVIFAVDEKRVEITNHDPSGTQNFIGVQDISKVAIARVDYSPSKSK